jgi:hypothetical protein
MASVGAAGFGPVDRNAVSDLRSGRYDQRPEALPSRERERARAVAYERRDNAAVAEGGQSPSTIAAREQIRTMHREMTGAEKPAGAGGIQRESRAIERRYDSREARPAVATAAEDLRTRMADDSRRAADAMTEAAAQRALREYSRAG